MHIYVPLCTYREWFYLNASLVVLTSESAPSKLMRYQSRLYASCPYPSCLPQWLPMATIFRAGMRKRGRLASSQMLVGGCRQQPWLSGLHHLFSDVAFYCKFPEKAPKSPSDLAEGSILLVPAWRKKFLLYGPQSLPGPASRIISFLLLLSLTQEIYLNKYFHKMYWGRPSLGLLK